MYLENLKTVLNKFCGDLRDKTLFVSSDVTMLLYDSIVQKQKISLDVVSICA